MLIEEGKRFIDHFDETKCGVKKDINSYIFSATIVDSRDVVPSVLAELDGKILALNAKVSTETCTFAAHECSVSVKNATSIYIDVLELIAWLSEVSIEELRKITTKKAAALKLMCKVDFDGEDFLLSSAFKSTQGKE